MNLRSKRTLALFLQIIGITTGLSCGVQLGNAYLVGLDIHLQNVLKHNLDFMKRYVDDCLVIVHDVTVEEVLEALNGWEENIVVTNDDVQRNSTTSLDLHLTLCEQRVRYKTYRKPKNSYMYLPRNSCHAPHIFDSIVHAELCRLRRTNDC